MNGQGYGNAKTDNISKKLCIMAAKMFHNMLTMEQFYRENERKLGGFF